MCTVTIIPLGNGLRLAANRDESRLRPVALPPRLALIEGRSALMPIDPQSGGTWIAVNDTGLVCTLLNAYSAPHDRNAPTPRVSRGAIIPRLLNAETLDEAFRRSGEINPDEYAAFHLVLADRRRLAVIHSDPLKGLSANSPIEIAAPILFTSSGLGDNLVGPPRLQLFKEFFQPGNDWKERQDAYHRHSWPERRHLSVCMSRPEARTVSLTIVEIEDGIVTMIYYPEAPDQPSEPTTATLECA